DYARESGMDFRTGCRSMMFIQVCDAAGVPLPKQFFGSMYQSEADYPVTGYTLNLPNYFEPNMDGLFGDNYWNKYFFCLNWGSVLGDTRYHDYSGQQIRLKFIQFYTINFAGIIDNWDWSSGTPIWNPLPITLNPPSSTDPTIHHIDNFQVRTFYMINLPPTIDKVADQEVKQHCGWQKINLTGITNGEGAISGDNEDLETQGSKSILKNIKRIKDVEQREDGSLKITAIVEENKKFREVVIPLNNAKASKFLTQKVITLELESKNLSLIPADSLKLEMEYVAGDTTAVLMYRPADKENGEAEIIVKLKDDGKREHGGDDDQEMTFKVTVLPFNPPVYNPEITELDNLVEDFGEININLSGHFSDPDPAKGEIYYSASCSNPSMMSVILTDNNLVIKSIENVNGTCNLTIVADDSTGTIPTVVTKTVIIADDGDDLCFSSGFASQELQLPIDFESKRIDISTQFTNELPSPPVYSVTQSNPAIIDAVFEGSELCLTSKPDVTGKTDITVNVTVDTRVISSHINVVAGNLPPVIKAEIPDIETPANFKTMYINLKDHYTDPNKDWLGYSVRTTQSKIDTYISFYDDQLIIESKANESGVDSLYISIYDGEFTVRDSLKITIGDVTTQVPYLTAPIEDFHAKEDFGRQEIDLNNHFADPNGNAIAYVVDFDSTKVKCTIEDGHTLVITSVKNFHGYAPMSVGIADGKKELRPSKFEGCDPKNVVTVRKKINRKHENN
ncbi:MAG: hypothetical protein KKD38_10305, partial [Candidatus Delongbacteria bacterium]|nr:hypothetical protein [Candidatus Delongbacteria bacterium]